MVGRHSRIIYTFFYKNLIYKNQSGSNSQILRIMLRLDYLMPKTFAKLRKPCNYEEFLLDIVYIIFTVYIHMSLSVSFAAYSIVHI